MSTLLEIEPVLVPRYRLSSQDLFTTVGITGGKMRSFLPSMFMPLLASQILWIFTSIDFVLYLVPVVTVKVTLNLPGSLYKCTASGLYCFREPSPKSQIKPTGNPIGSCEPIAEHKKKWFTSPSEGISVSTTGRSSVSGSDLCVHHSAAATMIGCVSSCVSG